MSRMRKPSEAAVQQFAARMTGQRQAAATVAAASNTAAVSETVVQVAGDVAAINVDGINATLADYEARLSALETP